MPSEGLKSLVALTPQLAKRLPTLLRLLLLPAPLQLQNLLPKGVQLLQQLPTLQLLLLLNLLLMWHQLLRRLSMLLLPLLPARPRVLDRLQAPLLLLLLQLQACPQLVKWPPMPLLLDLPPSTAAVENAVRRALSQGF